MSRKEIIKLCIAGAVFIVALACLISRDVINTAQAIESTILFVLVCVTIIYAKRTAEIAKETREQRIIASRPVVIQRDVRQQYAGLEYFSHFEIYNAGNGPAIELEISLLNKGESLIHGERKTFLRADEPPIEFRPTELIGLGEDKYYLVCEYQSTLSRDLQTWYQTRLPFKTKKASKKGHIYVIPGELEFKEVPEKGRIDAFGSKSKPK